MHVMHVINAFLQLVQSLVLLCIKKAFDTLENIPYFGIFYNISSKTLMER